MNTTFQPIALNISHVRTKVRCDRRTLYIELPRSNYDEKHLTELENNTALNIPTQQDIQ